MAKQTNILEQIRNMSKKQAFYLIVVLAACVGALVYVQTEKYLVDLDYLSFYTSEVRRSGASLVLATPEKTVRTGQTFSVDILLDTNREKIDGVDLYSLKYDPQLLDVQDSDLTQSGTQISSAGLMPIVVVNRVNEREGTIQFAQVTEGGTTYNGKGKIATVTFKALKSGSAVLSFDFVPGKTTDTNIASDGVDRLKNAASLNIAIR